MKRFTLFCILFFGTLQGITISPDLARELGNKIWHNECANSVEKLTFWKKGEQWASMGIGHFIWYSKNQKGLYDEQFPQLLQFLVNHKIALPAWLSPLTPCPWNNQEAFNKDLQSPRMQELRSLLKNTVDLQAKFIVQRFAQTLPTLMHACPAQSTEHIQQQITRLSKTPAGLYAMIDYMNFKGSGTSAQERYAGKGWGLLQVLEQMNINADPLEEFACSARQLLTQRVHNAPAERNENQWLAGWLNRVKTYVRP